MTWDPATNPVTMLSTWWRSLIFQPNVCIVGHVPTCCQHFQLLLQHCGYIGEFGCVHATSTAKCCTTSNKTPALYLTMIPLEFYCCNAAKYRTLKSKISCTMLLDKAGIQCCHWNTAITMLQSKHDLHDVATTCCYHITAITILSTQFCPYDYTIISSSQNSAPALEQRNISTQISNYILRLNTVINSLLPYPQ